MALCITYYRQYRWRLTIVFAKFARGEGGCCRSAESNSFRLKRVTVDIYGRTRGCNRIQEIPPISKMLNWLRLRIKSTFYRT